MGDITGYRTDDTAASVTAGLFVPLDPVRVFDTREEEVPPGPKGFVAAGATIDVAVAGAVGIPADAAAVVLNVTMVRPDGNGPVTVYPCGTRPLASSLNAPLGGGVVANEVVAKVSSSGSVCLYAGVGTHLVADVTGYVAE